MYLVCLHNLVAGEPDAFDRRCSRLSAAEFRRFLDRLAERWTLVSFSALLRAHEEGRPDPRAVALSFDDGFRGVHRHALPELRARGVDAAAFVSAAALAGGAPLFHFLELEIAFRLTTRRAALLPFLAEPELDLSTVEARVKAMKKVKKRLKTLPEAERRAGHEELFERLGVDRGLVERYGRSQEKYRTMSLGEARELRAAGWAVGSHTLTHRTLGMLEEAEARREIEGCKALLETLLGEKDEVFAYPYGEPVHIGRAAPRLCAEAGYRYAFTTVEGRVEPGAAPHLVNRVDYADFVERCREPITSAAPACRG